MERQVKQSTSKKLLNLSSLTDQPKLTESLAQSNKKLSESSKTEGRSQDNLIPLKSTDTSLQNIVS